MFYHPYNIPPTIPTTPAKSPTPSHPILTLPGAAFTLTCTGVAVLVLLVVVPFPNGAPDVVGDPDAVVMSVVSPPPQPPGQEVAVSVMLVCIVLVLGTSTDAGVVATGTGTVVVDLTGTVWADVLGAAVTETGGVYAGGVYSGSALYDSDSTGTPGVMVVVVHGVVVFVCLTGVAVTVAVLQSQSLAVV